MGEENMKRSIAAFAVVSIFCSVAAAQGNFESNRMSLKGLQGLKVIAFVGSGSEQTGLTKNQMQTDVELRLRMAGIKVLDYPTMVPGNPYLLVVVEALKPQEGSSLPFIAKIQLDQDVTLVRNPKHALNVSTFYVSNIGIASPQKLVAFSRESIGDLMDTFINAWLSVNPK
jgi:hypothetical protein